ICVPADAGPPAQWPFLFSSRRRHTRFSRDWSSDVCSSDLEELAFPITVRELVAMGRYPHLGNWRREGEADRMAIEQAMARCDVLGLADRPLATLSGGERQLV